VILFVDCVQQAESAFFRLSLTSEPSPEPGIFGLLPDYGQGSVSVSLVVLKPQYLEYIDLSRRFYTVTVTAWPLSSTGRAKNNNPLGKIQYLWNYSRADFSAKFTEFTDD